MVSSTQEEYFVYIDTGGTFTDCVVVREDGTYVVGKASTTPDDLSKGFFDAVSATVSKLGMTPAEVLSKSRAVGYGTTQGTNVVVTGAGAPNLGFITTKGHEDRTIIMRLRAAGLNPIEGMHIVAADKPRPIVPRIRIRGVSERVDCKGVVIVPLNENELRQVVKELVEMYNVDGIVIGFLWSHLNNVHEVRAKEIINELYPNLPVSLSSEVSPIVREYPRFVCTEIDLYIGRALRQLLDNIKDRLEQHGYRYSLLVMQASGGVARSEVVKPATTLHSGPVGGLAGVEFIKKLYNLERAIGTDMGGTSFDITVSSERGPEYLREPIVGRFQISNPMLEIVTAGAGGGTIAYVDEVTRTLRVGPASAGAVPGPVCYDQGGTEPTVTDANVVLNRIDPDYFLGGKRKLNREAALRAIEEKIAKPLAMDVYEAAEGIIRVIDATMAGALNTVCVTKGIDPSTYTLVSFGGAGPAHCAGYSASLPFKRIIIPKAAAVFSAFGASTADIRHRYEGSPFTLIPNIPYDVTTLEFKLNEVSLKLIPEWALDRFNMIVENLMKRAAEDMDAEGYREGQYRLRHEILGRYGGQLWEIRVEVPISTLKTDADLRTMLQRFQEEYMRVYARQAMVPRGGIEIVTVAVEAIAETPKATITKLEMAGKDPSAALKGMRNVWFDGWKNTKVYDWEKLGHGNEILGPAIIEAEETTLVVPPGRKVWIDEYGNANME